MEAARQDLDFVDRELASMVTAQSSAWDTVAPYFKEVPRGDIVHLAYHEKFVNWKLCF